MDIRSHGSSVIDAEGAVYSIAQARQLAIANQQLADMFAQQGEIEAVLWCAKLAEGFGRSAAEAHDNLRRVRFAGLPRRAAQ